MGLYVIMSLNFKFSKNNVVLKEFNINSTSLNDFSEYRKSLKSLQGTVNEYLTTLINTETGTLEPVQHEDYEDSLSSDSESERSPKRNLSNDRESQKNKVQKH